MKAPGPSLAWTGHARHSPSPAIRFIGQPLPTDEDGFNRLESLTERKLTHARDAANRSQNAATSRAVSQMANFRRDYPAVTADMDESVQAAGEYRRLRDQLVNDDLPRFEAEFKRFLNTNTIRDIATFQSQLIEQQQLIRERIETINASLVGIDYNPGRSIRLQGDRTSSTDIRDFVRDLRDCTDNSLFPDNPDQYSEQKFLQVK